MSEAVTVAASPILAIQAWFNANRSLRGTREQPGPLTLGAELHIPRSPGEGAVVVLERTVGASMRSPVAEAGPLVVVPVAHLVYSAKQAASERAGEAVARALEGLAGDPEPMGGWDCRAVGDVTGPIYVPQPDQAGHDFCHQVNAEYLLVKPEGVA